MEEKRLDELLNEEMTMNEEEIKRTEKIINKKMNEKILRRSLIVSLAVVLITAACIAGVYKYQNYLEDKNAFHLDELEMTLGARGIEGWTQEQIEEMNAFIYAHAHATLFYPGMVLSKGDNSISGIEKVAPGIYRFSVLITDLFEVPFTGGHIETVKVEIRESSLDIGDYSYSERGRITQNTEYLSHFGWDTDMRNEIESLPETSIVSLDVMFHEALSMDELLEYQRNHMDSRVIYAVTHCSNPESSQEDWIRPYGFNLYEGNTYSAKMSWDTWTNYPSLTLNEDSLFSIGSLWKSIPDYTCKELENHYLSCMKLLVNNHIVWCRDDLIKIIADVEENGVQVRGMRIYASQKDALELYDHENVRSIMIQDVKLSKYQK